MSIFFYKVWLWCKRTILSAKWWKEHWYIPLILLGMLIVRMLSGTTSILKLNKKIQNIKEKEREEITHIKDTAKDKEKDVEEQLGKDKDKVKKETENKVVELKKKIKEDNEKIKDNSVEINNALNDILDD